ncbi:hypothetical protein [Bradyrhizobium sp. STM 3562]|uniref:hypothetical protein n=1 Tax=Bradyrhizobium sp. STM 3562 TaxID=578924 RepID=UPI00388FED9E
MTGPAPRAAAWWAGLINDIPTVKELIDRTVAEPERLVRQRLTGLLEGTLEETPRKKTMRAVA